MSPLLVELAALAGGLLAYLLRHPAARLAVRAEHAVGHAFRSVFEHGFHRVRSRHS